MIKVLVIDDSALMRKLLGRVLADASDFEVYFARNGLEGLEQLAAVSPDVVTLDIHMPDMDGLACLDRIMIERPRPVVMVSSLTREGADATLEALRLGAVDFVPKPEGAVSLHMEVFGPLFVAKVRAAAGVKLRASLRLRERVQHRIGGRASVHRPAGGRNEAASVRASGEGIVVVGASTGGPPALEELLVALPSTFPWPIVIAQHMPANFTGALARRLDGLCAIDVSRGSAHHGARTWPRLYRARRRRRRYFECRGRSRRDSGTGRCQAPVASERRPVGGERHLACFAKPLDRHSDDRHGRRRRRIHDETTRVRRADDR